MKVEIKNPNQIPTSIRPLFDYFQSLSETPKWHYYGLIVELDPTIDFKGNTALIRWTDIIEGFNDKIIVHSIEEFQSTFKISNA